jgi:uncharacterized protein (DUF885 family)
MRYRLPALLAGALLAVACTREAPDSELTNTSPSTSAEFAAMLDEHFEKNLALHPVDATDIGDYRYNDQYANSIGPEHRARQHELNSEVLARLAAIARSQLNAQEQLS